MTRPDYCPIAQEPCQAMCVFSDVRCKIRDNTPQVAPQVTQQEKQESYWEEEARRYAGNADFWREKAKRQPLTEEEMLEILVGIDAETKRLPPGMKAFARAIERAHGIGGEHD